MSTKQFSSLNLHSRTLDAVAAAGYREPTEIQHRTIPELNEGRDILGTAQTGTGKTAAFVLPMLQRIERPPRSNAASPAALILTPTRELAAQIHESIGVYGRGSHLRSVAVFGGASKHKQEQLLRKHPDIIVATPGRLLDFMSDGVISLRQVTYLVLDEADRMLDMGFIPSVRRIVREVPTDRQTALFSATMPKPIRSLAQELLRDPMHIEAESGELAVEKITQSMLYVEKADKYELLQHLIGDRNMYKALVFTRTKHRAGKIAKKLAKNGIKSDAIHGDKSQGARTRALAAFRSGSIQVLVATDVASRGIDVDDITHVINFELPNEPETYVHRIGRTARAGAEGTAVSLCDETEEAYVRDIERLMGISIPVDESHEFHREPQKSTHSGPAPRVGGQHPPKSRDGGQASHQQGDGRQTRRAPHHGGGNTRRTKRRR